MGWLNCVGMLQAMLANASLIIKKKKARRLSRAYLTTDH